MGAILLLPHPSSIPGWTKEDELIENTKIVQKGEEQKWRKMEGGVLQEVQELISFIIC